MKDVSTQKIITHLTTAHNAFDTRIFYKECKSLAQMNYAISLIVPHGASLTHENVKIIAVKPPKNRYERLFYTTFLVFKEALRQKADLYHFHDPELIFCGVALKLFGKKVIYDVHENYHEDILIKPYIPFFLKKILAPLIILIEKTGALFFDSIVVVTPHISKKFSQKKTHLIQNYVIPLKNLPHHSYLNKYSSTHPFKIAYVGTLNKHRAIQEMLEAIHLLQQENHLKFILAGHFCDSKLEKKLENYLFHPKIQWLHWLRSNEINQILKQSHLGLCLFYPTPSYIETLPTKVFEYMSAGIPVLSSNFPILKNIILKHNCGLTVESNNPEEIKEKISWFIKHPDEAKKMGQNGYQAALNFFNWKNEARTLSQVYNSILKLT